MLNLSRTVGEAVRIGDDIEVQVERITGNCVRLGFTAPREVRIYREEVYRERASAREAAAAAAASRAAGSPVAAGGARPRSVGARGVSGREPVTRSRPRPRVAGHKHRER